MDTSRSSERAKQFCKQVFGDALAALEEYDIFDLNDRRFLYSEADSQCRILVERLRNKLRDHLVDEELGRRSYDTGLESTYRSDNQSSQSYLSTNMAPSDFTAASDQTNSEWDAMLENELGRSPSSTGEGREHSPTGKEECTKSGESKCRHLYTLTQLKTVIAGPEALCQLASCFATVREDASIRLPSGQCSLAKTMSHMCQMNSTLIACQMLKRFDRYRLHVRRENLRQKFSPRKTLDKMMKEAHPGLNHHHPKNSPKKLRKSLQNQLRSGNNWIAMVEKFGMASIALVPSGGRKKIWNESLENVPKRLFTEFLLELDLERGHIIRELSKGLNPYIMSIFEGRDRDSEFKFEKLSEEDLVGKLQDTVKISDICSLVARPEG